MKNKTSLRAIIKLILMMMIILSIVLMSCKKSDESGGNFDSYIEFTYKGAKYKTALYKNYSNMNYLQFGNQTDNYYVDVDYINNIELNKEYNRGDGIVFNWHFKNGDILFGDKNFTFQFSENGDRFVATFKGNLTEDYNDEGPDANLCVGKMVAKK